MADYAKSFRELNVYALQKKVSRRIFIPTKRFPREEAFSLTDQVRRAVRSVGGQIAEAWGKRRYPKHFISKLTDADGEQMETQHWLDEALDCGYISNTEHSELIADLEGIGRMLGAMMQKADRFCGGDPWGIHEELALHGQQSVAEFFSDSTDLTNHEN